MKKIFLMLFVLVLLISSTACSKAAMSDEEILAAAEKILDMQGKVIVDKDDLITTTDLELPAVSTPEPTPEPTPDPTPEPTPEFGTRKNPVPLGETLTGSIQSSGSSLCDFEMRIDSVIRGKDAWTKIKKANMFNDKPTSTYEYVLVKVYIKNVKDLSESDAPLEINQYNFDLATSNDSISDNQPSIVLPKPEFSFKLYEGAEEEGYIAFWVEKTETNIKAVFIDDFWFSLT